MGRSVQAYVETGVNDSSTGGVAAWAFDLDHWGRCGQGPTQSLALRDLLGQCGYAAGSPVETRERVHGDEQAFSRDLQPPTSQEVTATLGILGEARSTTLALVAGATAEQLDHDDPGRVLPAWASWRTARQMAWHIADTESRYYLPSLGLPSRPREADLSTELTLSAEHVRSVVQNLPAEQLVRHDGGEVWTSVKLLRRLAWHERSELRVLEGLLSR